MVSYATQTTGQAYADRRTSLVYQELIELLADSTDSDRVLAFRLSDNHQEQLDALLEKNRDGMLTAHEAAELATFEQFEHVVRMLKAKLLQRRAAS
jgi:hypothetical protein